MVDDPAVGPRHPTSTLGVIGWPVSASLSPTIHNAAFRALGLDWDYVPLPVRPEALPEALRGLRALGFAGANVTMPHKTAAADLVDVRSEEADLLRSVNTLVVTPDGLEGHNTDAPGFDRFLREDLAFDPADRFAVVPFADAASESPDLIVNATPVGRAGESLPLPPLGPGMVVVDLLYRPAVTPLQATARAAGAIATNGLGLLLHQAALAFERWTGQVPPIDVMSAAAVAALAERPG